ncbi:sensor histidine kinase [Haloechinothrix sp. LS1_15]|uniref:sensor histidine kinase n=1 Tax=Haloechinothrix sp. LS1_15 TaxID=2652248 RepID=UPI00294520DB|nr:sensor histidine kinase [Haloechinothrix sp. LS1_15]MDV6012997.1 sensor histidine kinase [Haloechinothrix sp. LS1_15]
MRPRFTLAGQFLAIQLVIIVLVLIAVTGASVAQSDATFRQTEGQRMRAIAETGATHEAVRMGVSDVGDQGILQPTAESLRSLSGADKLIVTRRDLRILTSPDPGDLDQPLAIGDSPVLEGRAWTGMTPIGGEDFLVAHVPVIAEGGDVIGLVAAARRYPGFSQRLVAAAPNLLIYLGIAGSLGVTGSVLLARRVKRQTLGLEPAEITSLAEHREAILHGIKEGVIALDSEHRITMVNDKAIELLRLPRDCAQRRLAELDIDPALHQVLTGTTSGRDQVVTMGDRLVTLNRMPLVTGGKAAGSVTTMRDRTDLVELKHELDVTRTTTEALRAQAHEFSNQLHVITGLLELGEYDEVNQYIGRVSGARAQLSEDITASVADPSVAALLIAKSSRAAEQGAELRVSPRSELGQLSEDLSADLTTVVGNLVDNALDAVASGERSSAGSVVEVRLAGDADGVWASVRDSGPGVPNELHDEIFRHGFSTKTGTDPEGRGLGLAITQLVCARRGGHVRIASASPAGGDEHREDTGAAREHPAPLAGAEFVAWLPLAPSAGERNRPRSSET